MSNDYCFGLTATRHGMSFEQKAAFRNYLAGSVGILHHGMCIGGDADGHGIAREIGYFIVGHPPTNKSLMADLDCEEVWPAKPYLDRNKDIAKCGHALIAAPSEPEEQSRGGTWSTYRYAKTIGRTTILILPNGKIIQRDHRHLVGGSVKP
jgi:hypothetical protein